MTTLNEPSPIAAAEELLNCAAYSHLRRSEREVAFVAEHFQKFADAATAKLREEIAGYKEMAESQFNTAAKLREKLADKDAQLSRWVQATKEQASANKILREQLAHQQPSEPPDGVNQSRWVEPDEHFTNQQPSATTPDVEKIAREINTKVFNGRLTFYVEREIATILAQAREPLQRDCDKWERMWRETQQNFNKMEARAIASERAHEPLVAALKQARKIIANSDRPLHIKVTKAIDAALTGTEEKK